jgi:hypothetical protein
MFSNNLSRTGLILSWFVADNGVPGVYVCADISPYLLMFTVAPAGIGLTAATSNATNDLYNGT